MTNRIETFKATRARKVRGTNVVVGQELYAVYNEQTSLYFIWCYSDRAFAEHIANKVSPKDPTDISYNWRKSTDELVASDVKQEHHNVRPD